MTLASCELNLYMVKWEFLCLLVFEFDIKKADQ